MARTRDREKVIKLRLKGSSYSQIKETLGISKSTLSGWLADYPLSPERIKELRDKNPRRIENYIRTMKKKREVKYARAYDKAKKDIAKLSKRDMYIAGLCLYWGEGFKTKVGSTALSNTDPGMIIFFIKWLETMGISKIKLKANLHLYKDMNEEKEINFWSRTIGLPKNQFRRPYIKKSNISDITYKNGFGHGTCTVRYENVEFNRYVIMGIKYIKDKYGS